VTDLPPGWGEASVGVIASSLIDGPFGSNLKSEHYQSSGVRVIRLQNIADGRFDDRDKAYISLDHFNKLNRHEARPGDVLIAALGEVLPRVCLVPPDIDRAIVKADCFRLRPYKGISANYLAYILSAPQIRKRASTEIAGVGRPRLNLGKVSSLVIPVPPFAEQERIVAAIEEQFSRLDAGVAALERVRRNLSRMRSAAFALIADSVDAWLTLGEIAEVVGGVTKDAKRQSDPSFVEVPYLRVANVQRGYLDLSTVTTIRVPTNTVEKLRLEPGDILFNEGGDRDKLGRGWIWEGKIKDCIHQNHVFRARLLTDKFDPRFVSMHGNTFGRTWFEKMGKQTTNLASLNLTTLKAFPVPDLPVEQQREIVSEVERRLSLIGSLQSATDDSLARCNSLRSSILATAFSGMLVPQDSTDEPASALLERIAAERAASNGRSSARTRKPRTPQEKVVV
jgi:type I restriction enzyme S subunit